MRFHALATDYDGTIAHNGKVDEATAIAKASPAPSLVAIDRNVWADGGAAWRN